MKMRSDDEVEGRLTGLFDEMEALQPLLARILETCEREQPVADVNALVSEAQGAHSVFDGPALCHLLERAGGIERIDVGEAKDAEVVSDQGRAYLRPAPARSSLWVTTEAGRSFLARLAEGDDGSLDELMEEESQAWPAYEDMLRVIGAGDGLAQQDVRSGLGGSASFREIRSTTSVAHMLDRARHAGAIEWDGGWRLTELGRRIAA